MKKSTALFLCLAALSLASASRVEAAPPITAVGTSMSTVICPAKATDTVDVYDLNGHPNGMRVKAYEAVKLFQGWGENAKILKIGASSWKLVRVQLPNLVGLQSATFYIYEGFIAPESVCQKRIPYIKVDPHVINVVGTDMDADGDEGAEEGGKEDVVPTIIGTVTQGVSNLIMGLNSPNCCLMPIETKPNSYLSGMGRFGWGRPGRIHAGVDLYGKNGQLVRAVANGQVIREPYFFKQMTLAVDIRHEGGFVVRYGEISQRSFGMRNGTNVTRGQQVGAMQKLPCCEPMLHMELYSGAASGPLTLKHVGKYWRRSDLVDPTKYITKWPVK